MTLVRPHPLDLGNPPAWASAWGEDRYGIFTAFAVGGVEQRLRWIAPGTFLIGSPENEEGRFGDEVRHRVTLTEGYWLADTPCAQALWQEVTGHNPSRFKTPDRPVEQVSWEDCQEFFSALEERVPGVGARLPTEAEWEHACRAGTETATWAGDLRIQGANHASILDDIAWYGGNSGQGFELEEGEDSSGWPERQYPHTLAGTRPVALKVPNPWGLYDMLGNVWEWCEDWFGSYQAKPVIDPTGPTKGTYRVYRGGSWYSIARFVRAAYRLPDLPSFRWFDQGFRLARGQSALEQGAEPPGRGAPRRRSRPRTAGGRFGSVVGQAPPASSS